MLGSSSPVVVGNAKFSAGLLGLLSAPMAMLFNCGKHTVLGPVGRFLGTSGKCHLRVVLEEPLWLVLPASTTNEASFTTQHGASETCAMRFDSCMQCKLQRRHLCRTFVHYCTISDVNCSTVQLTGPQRRVCTSVPLPPGRSTSAGHMGSSRW